MLKGIDPVLTPDLLWVLAAMGHGDELAVVDRNFPASSVARDTNSGRLLALPGLDTTRAVAAIVELLPLDSFVDTALWHMAPVDQAGVVLPVHHEIHRVCLAAADHPIRMDAMERSAFYAAARRCFALVHTSDDRPYACFILKKGVVFEARLP
ncbi:MAG: fucose dissimilation pathway protein FucU [Pseudomonadota bacterium]|nr:fucose dissimilation pathway protein FucU [Pseudomonadota bacterium]